MWVRQESIISSVEVPLPSPSPAASHVPCTFAVHHIFVSLNSEVSFCLVSDSRRWCLFFLYGFTFNSLLLGDIWWQSSVWWQVSGLFPLLHSLPLCGWTSIYFPFPLWMEIWMPSKTFVSPAALLCISLYMSPWAPVWAFLQETFLGVELLGPGP